MDIYWQYSAFDNEVDCAATNVLMQSL